MFAITIIFLTTPIIDFAAYVGLFVGCVITISSTIRSVAEVWTMIQEQKRINRDFELNLKIKKRNHDKL